VVNAPALPAGDPDLLEQLADQLTGQASQAGDLAVTTANTTDHVRGGAQWSGSAADAYTGFTAAMSRGLSRTPAPLGDIASAVRGYAVVLRTAQARTAAYNTAVQQAQASDGDTASLAAAYTAQADANAANAQLQAAGQQAAAQVKAATAALDDVFAPEGVLRGTIEEIHTVLGATGADGTLWALGRGAEQAKQFMDNLPALEKQWLHDLVPWGQSASQDEFDAAVQRWWAKADAAEVFGEEFKNGTRVLGLISRVGRLAGGPIAIAGDVSTIIDPPQSGAAGMADRVMAGTNGVLVAGDTAGALGEALGVEALADLSLGPVGVGVAIGTGLYLAGAYAYKHWAWFRQDLAQPVGHAVAHVTSDIGHGLGDAAHTVASWF
jgi:hypothetical protein